MAFAGAQVLAMKAASFRLMTRARSLGRLISDAYFHKGYAWYPIDRLQLEQAATLGRVEAAPIVAERMSVVYQARVDVGAGAFETLTRVFACARQTLNTVAPRFPSMFD